MKLSKSSKIFKKLSRAVSLVTTRQSPAKDIRFQDGGAHDPEQ